MSKDKRQDAVEQQHSQEQDASDILVPMTDCDYTTGTSPQGNIAELQKAFSDSYESKRAKEFEESRAIAQERLDRLQETGFNPTEQFDEASTADAIEAGQPYDFYQHLHDSEGQSASRERGGKTDQNEHAANHNIRKGSK